MAWGGWIRGRKAANDMGLPYVRLVNIKMARFAIKIINFSNYKAIVISQADIGPSVVATGCQLASNREVKVIKNEFRIFGRDPHLDVGLTPAALKGATTFSKMTIVKTTLSITIKD
jgi:hypothetical protein